MEMKSRIVEVCAINKRDFETDLNGNKIIPHEENCWITLQWFHPSDYETQEQLNDASENFADLILRHTNIGVFIRIQEITMKGGEGIFETIRISEKTRLLSRANSRFSETKYFA